MAFIRKKRIKGNIYYYIVENRWMSGKCRQKVLAYLGTADALLKQIKKGRI